MVFTQSRFAHFEDYLAEEVPLTLLEQRGLITRDMPPPRVVVEVMSSGDENSENYKRDYEVKPQQYAAIAVPEYWIIDPEREWVMVDILKNDSYQFEYRLRI